MTHLLALMDQGNLNLASPVFGTPFLPLAQLTLERWIKFTIEALLVVGAVAFFIYLLMGAIQWITAGGDKDGTEKARKKITGAVIGLAILFSAYAILILVSTVFFGDKQILSLPIPKL